MGLFDKFISKKSTGGSYSPSSEHEAAFAILYAIVSADGEVTDAESNGVLRGIMRKRRYLGYEWSDIFKRVIVAFQISSPSEIIKASVNYIPEDFRSTIFCLAVEAIMHDGEMMEEEFKIIDFLAQEMGIEKQLSEKIVHVLMIKNDEDVPLADN